MQHNLRIFPLIKTVEWTFRASVYNQEQIMVFGFGPESQFLMRYFTDEDHARVFIDECVMGKHFE
jgi:hypothetical protein